MKKSSGQCKPLLHVFLDAIASLKMALSPEEYFLEVKSTPPFVRHHLVQTKPMILNLPNTGLTFSHEAPLQPI